MWWTINCSHDVAFAAESLEEEKARHEEELKRMRTERDEEREATVKKHSQEMVRID